MVTEDLQMSKKEKTSEKERMGDGKSSTRRGENRMEVFNMDMSMHRNIPLSRRRGIFLHHSLLRYLFHFPVFFRSGWNRYAVPSRTVATVTMIRSFSLTLPLIFKNCHFRNLFFLWECVTCQYPIFSEWNILTQHLLSLHTCFSFGLLLCMYTGLRIRELSGLKWGDIQWSSEVYRIRNLAYIPGFKDPRTLLHIGSPKTASSRPQISLPAVFLTLAGKYRSNPEYYILTGTDHCMELRTIQWHYQCILKECVIFLIGISIPYGTRMSSPRQKNL